jgi:hypothetical protein
MSHSTAPTEYNLLGTWDSNGVPNYLFDSHEITRDLIYRVINELPEAVSVPNNEPQYLTTGPASHNIVINSSDQNFTGADLYVTFIYEGAGYFNTIGYYTYPLNPIDIHDLSKGYYTVPTVAVYSESVLTGYRPMVYGEQDAVDSNGKSILKKTIIFPNVSLANGWWTSINKYAGGGNMKPGQKVRILYDITNSSSRFPNLTGVGFFLIPNGWNTNNLSVRNTTGNIYTDSVFNTSNGYQQTLILFDAINSTYSTGNVIVTFEDIMLPDGDSDYNDCVIMVSYTPQTCFNTDNFLVLPASGTISTSGWVVDNTGMYLRLKDADVASYYNQTAVSIKATYTLALSNYTMCKRLYDIFQLMTFENSGNVTYGSILDTKGNPISLNINIQIPRLSIQNYNYVFNAFSNRLTDSPIDEKVSNLVSFQDYFVRNVADINNYESVIKKSEDDSILEQNNRSPDHSQITTPYGLGDPHMTTIFGDKYLVPNVKGILNLYDDSYLKINAELDYHPLNQKNPEHPLHKDLTFIKLISLQTPEGHIIIDAFTPDIYFDVSDLFVSIKSHPNFRFLHEESSEIVELARERKKEYMKILGNHAEKPINLRYVAFKTPQLADVCLEIMFIPSARDTINSVAIISKNLLLSNARGAMIHKRHARKLGNKLY